MKSSSIYLGLIPARGGSKGIIKKNLKDVLGKPLIEHTFEAVKHSKLLNKTFVSTDDEDIIKHTNKFNLIPIERPKNIAADLSPMSDVIEHFINHSLKVEYFEDVNIVLLQPTSPLRDGNDIDKAILSYERSSANCLVSVRKSKDPIHKSFYLGKNGSLITIFDEKDAHKRRQDLQKTFHPNGAIYIFSIKSFLHHREIPLNHSIPFYMDDLKSIDIDTLDDIKYLEYFWSLKND